MRGREPTIWMILFSRWSCAVFFLSGLIEMVACGPDREALLVADGGTRDLSVGQVADAQKAIAFDAATTTDFAAMPVDASNEMIRHLCGGPIPLSYNAAPPGDAFHIKSIVCTSTAPGSDVEIKLQETSLRSGLFVALVTQATPTSLNEDFCAIPSWSGHFFNFDDTQSAMGDLMTVFHLRTRGLGSPNGDYPGDDNVQVHWSWTSNTGDLSDRDIHCVAAFN
jgi:hypothetical protein